MNTRTRAALAEVLQVLSPLNTEEIKTVLKLATDALVPSSETERLDAVVASLIQNPTSKTSRSLARNTSCCRNRDGSTGPG